MWANEPYRFLSSCPLSAGHSRRMIAIAIPIGYYGKWLFSAWSCSSGWGSVLVSRRYLALSTNLCRVLYVYITICGRLPVLHPKFSYILIITTIFYWVGNSMEMSYPINKNWETNWFSVKYLPIYALTLLHIVGVGAAAFRCSRLRTWCERFVRCCCSYKSQL